MFKSKFEASSSDCNLRASSGLIFQTNKFRNFCSWGVQLIIIWTEDMDKSMARWIKFLQGSEISKFFSTDVLIDKNNWFNQSSDIHADFANSLRSLSLSVLHNIDCKTLRGNMDVEYSVSSTQKYKDSSSENLHLLRKLPCCNRTSQSTKLLHLSHTCFRWEQFSPSTAIW